MGASQALLLLRLGGEDCKKKDPVQNMLHRVFTTLSLLENLCRSKGLVSGLVSCINNFYAHHVSHYDDEHPTELTWSPRCGRTCRPCRWWAGQGCTVQPTTQSPPNHRRASTHTREPRHWEREREGERLLHGLPNQQCTLDKLSTELQCKNFVYKNKFPESVYMV